MTPATQYMLNTSLTLAGIMIVAWLVVHAARRWERAAPRGPLELLGTLRLEGKRAVYLVRIGERVVALGAADGGIIKIMELSSPELSSSELAAPAGVGSFGTLLGRLKQQSRTNAGAPVPSGTPETQPNSETSPADPKGSR